MCLHYQPGSNGDTLLKEAQRLVDQILPSPLCSFVNSAEPGRKLRIGYASANFTHHPVGYFLHAVPDSRLLLKWKSLTNERVRQQLTNHFSKEGIGSERLIPRGSSPHEAMLRGYGEIDIALDPFPFSGGLTSCEALWMGVPVVTLPGTEAVSRQTLGFLRAIERTEWGASTPEDYIRIASDLAADKGLLTAIRAGQRQRMAASPLCDGKAFARQLEAAYRSMWQEWCNVAQGGLPG